VTYVAWVLLLLAVTHGAVWVTAAPQPFDDRVAMVWTDRGFTGSAFRANGIVRTAHHVFNTRVLQTVGWPGQMSVAQVVCSDSETDSVTIESDVPLRGYGIGAPPFLGDKVSLLGWRMAGNAYVLVERTAFVHGYVRYVTFNRQPPVFIGPVVMLTFRGRADGMSGGPVIYRGMAIASISAYDGEHVYAIPLQNQKCPHSIGRPNGSVLPR